MPNNRQCSSSLESFGNSSTRNPFSNDAPGALDVKSVFADFRCLAFESANLFMRAELECRHVGAAAARPHCPPDKYGDLDHGGGD
jgi:hypothetical protein